MEGTNNVRGDSGAPSAQPEERWLAVAFLPPPETKRWVIDRKARVVAAVRSGDVSLDEVCLRYNLTVEEFLNWTDAINRWMDQPLFKRR